MVRRPFAHFFAAWVGFLTLTLPCTAEPIFPPGSRVGLDPPGDLKPSTRFSGFEDPDRKVAINILDLPGVAYGGLKRAATAKIAGSEFKQESFPFRSGSGQLFSGTVQVNGATLHKWVLLTTAADRNLTAMVDVEVPETAASVYTDAAVRKALASVTFRDTPIQERLGLLPFKLGDLAGFRVKQVLPGGVLLTNGQGENAGNEPYAVVSVGSGAPESADDRSRFARDLLVTAPLRNLKLQSADRMRISGAPGYEIRAEAEGGNGEPVMVAQWLRFSGARYLRIIGVGGKANWDATFMRLRSLRDGIEIP